MFFKLHHCFGVLVLFANANAEEFDFKSSCFCSKCNPSQTVGVIGSDGRCFFIERNTPFYMYFFYKQQQVTTFYREPYFNREWLDIFHILTRRYYKKFNAKFTALRLMYIKKERSVIMQDLLRMPSYDVRVLQCPTYDITTNILYDRVNNCLLRIESIFVTHQFNRTVDEPYNWYNLERPYEFELSEPVNGNCEIINVTDRDTFTALSDFLMTTNLFRIQFFKSQERGIFVIRYDPQRINLTKDDYFMHLPSYASQIRPSGCHIIDATTGKIFHQPDCATAVSILNRHFFNQSTSGSHSSPSHYHKTCLVKLSRVSTPQPEREPTH